MPDLSDPQSEDERANRSDARVIALEKRLADLEKKVAALAEGTRVSFQRTNARVNTPRRTDSGG